MSEEEVKEGLEVLLDNLVKEDIECSAISRYNALVRNSRTFIEEQVGLSPEDLRFNVYAEYNPAERLIPASSEEKRLYYNSRLDDKVEELSQEPKRSFIVSPYLKSYFAARDSKDNLNRILSSTKVTAKNIQNLMSDLFSTKNQNRYGEQLFKTIRLEKKWLKAMYNQIEKTEEALDLLEKAYSREGSSEQISRIKELKKEFAEFRNQYHEIGGEKFLDTLPEDLSEIIGKAKEAEKLFQLLQLKDKCKQKNNTFLRNDSKGLDYILLEEKGLLNIRNALDKMEGGDYARFSLVELLNIHERNKNNPLELSIITKEDKGSSELEKIKSLLEGRCSEDIKLDDAYRIIKMQEIKGRIKGGEKLSHEQIMEEYGIENPVFFQESKEKIDEMLNERLFDKLVNIYSRLYTSKEDVKNIKNLLQKEDFQSETARDYLDSIEETVNMLKNQATSLKETSPIFSNQTIKDEGKEYRYNSIVEEYINELNNLKSEIKEFSKKSKVSKPKNEAPRRGREPYRININERSVFDYLEEFENSLRAMNGGELSFSPYDIKILSEETPNSIMGEDKTEALRKKINNIMKQKGYLVVEKIGDPELSKTWKRLLGVDPLTDDNNQLETIPERITGAGFDLQFKNISTPLDSSEAYRKAWLAIINTYQKTNDIKNLSPEESYDLTELNWLEEPKDFSVADNDNFNHYNGLKTLINAARKGDVKEIERQSKNLFLSEDPKMGLKVQIRPQTVDYLKGKYYSLQGKEKDEAESALRIAEQFNDQNVIDYAKISDGRKMADFLARYMKE